MKREVEKQKEENVVSCNLILLQGYGKKKKKIFRPCGK